MKRYERQAEEGADNYSYPGYENACAVWSAHRDGIIKGYLAAREEAAKDIIIAIRAMGEEEG